MGTTIVRGGADCYFLIFYLRSCGEQFTIGMLKLQAIITNTPITNSNLITKRYTRTP
ncbi:hypothetical protein HMPREF9554_01622 [Treponema phagedenis F0421]|nr:hypothetical protein HMPREF9554_01622 [Treponema phagedenis F0421]